MATHTERKSILLRFFTDSTTALGARLIGLAVALFTLLQAVQTSGENKFSQFMPYFPPIMNLNVPVAWMTPLLCLLVFGLITYIVRTLFRYATYMGLCSYVIATKETDPSLREAEDPLHKTYLQVIDLMKTKKLFWVFPITWFISSKEFQRENRLGWLASLLLAFALTTCLLWLLW